VAGWYIEKGNGQGETGPMDDGQRWDWPLVVEALGRAPFQAALTRAMATHGLTFGEYVSGRFLPNLGWTAHLEDGVPVARDNSRIPIAHGWDEIVAKLRSIPADQEIGLHIWRTWPAGDAIEGGQPFALRQIAPCLIDLAGLYLEALGPKA
jgi:hypothetical protein